MREFLEQGFEVLVVSDGTAAAVVPDGDGYAAALTNFRFMANAVRTTEQVATELVGAETAERFIAESRRASD
jgi:nicotinamidase-related amidase